MEEGGREGGREGGFKLNGTYTASMKIAYFHKPLI